MKASSCAAIALAFASLGDAFLYPFLPVNSHIIGVPITWIGMILSVNRFVRIAANLLMGHAFTKYGLRTIVIIAVILAIASTFGYAFATSLTQWLMLRLLWGISFSALRIGTLAYSLQQPRRGFALGLSRSLQELGPMFSLFLAPVLLKSYDSRSIFYLLALLSLPALFFALQLPGDNEKRTIPQNKVNIAWPSRLDLITFTSSVLIDGIIVVTLGILFLHCHDGITLMGATTMAAVYLGYRRICLVCLSLVGGWAADKVGIAWIFIVSTSLVVLGMFLILLGWIGIGAVVIFTFYSIQTAITPGLVAPCGKSLRAVAVNATWRDVGAAVGVLVGGFLVSSSYVQHVLLSGIVVMILLILFNMKEKLHAFKISPYGNNGGL